MEIGIIDFHGFQSIIPTGTALPTRKKLRFTSVFDDIRHCDFLLAYRFNPCDMYAEVGTARLNQIQRGRAEDIRMNVVLELDQTLDGTLSAWDTLIGYRTVLKFHIQLNRKETGLTETPS